MIVLFFWNEFESCNSLGVIFCMSTINIPKYNDYPSSWSSCAQNQRHLCCTLAHFNFTHPFSSTVDVTKHSFEPWNKKRAHVFFRWPAVICRRQPLLVGVTTIELKWHKERFRCFSHFLGVFRAGNMHIFAWWLSAKYCLVNFLPWNLT